MEKHLFAVMSFWISVGIYIGSRWSGLYFAGGDIEFTLLAINFVAMAGAFYLMEYVLSCLIGFWKWFNVWIGK